MTPASVSALALTMTMKRIAWLLVVGGSVPTSNEPVRDRHAPRKFICVASGRLGGGAQLPLALRRGGRRALAEGDHRDRDGHHDQRGADAVGQVEAGVERLGG